MYVFLHCRPIFSTDDLNSDKHKMERFLHEGSFSIASIYAPISFPPLPLVVVKDAQGDAPPAVAAVGSLKSVDPDRIILKRIILTGYDIFLLNYVFFIPVNHLWGGITGEIF